MICAMYIRVSTDDQLEFSPDAQKRALTEYAKKNGYQIDDRYIFIDEGISGTSAKRRPSFMRMIATAKQKPKPFDAILVHKFDRFARSREDSVVYKSLLRKECGIKVISITEQMEDDKFSVILEAMLEAMAEYYSLNLSDEVMKGMEEKARRGGVQTRPCLGYDIVDNKRVININESKTVNKIYELCISGNSLGTIAKTLNRLGYRNKTGNLFDSRRIKYILENPVYIGVNRWNLTTYKGNRKITNDKKDWIVVENAHEPIIDKETWEEAQKALSKWHKDVKPRSTNYIHWLGGILRCSKCGTTLVYKTARFPRKDGTIRNADGFQCGKFKGGSCDTSNYISVINIENQVRDILREALNIVNETGSLNGLNVENTRVKEEIELYDMQLSKLNHKLDLAKNAYLNEIDTLEEYKQNKKAIQAEIDEINNLINNNELSKEVICDFKNKFINAINAIDDNTLSIESKNNYLKTFIRSIVYDKANGTLTANFYI